MPITPFHFGPGLAAKSLAPLRFSWTAFAATQVFIDFETAYNIATRRYPLHRELHTFIGATAAGVLVGALLAACVRALRLGRLLESKSPEMRAELDGRALFAGAVIGGASHPFFDGLMHSDIRPFAPWTDSNPLLGVIGLGALHLGCLSAGMVGVVLLHLRGTRKAPGSSTV